MFDCHYCKRFNNCHIRLLNSDMKQCSFFILDTDALRIDIGAYYTLPRTHSTLPKTNVIEEYATPERIILNFPATIVFWKDGTKTVVKCAAGTDPDLYNAFCAALAKKVFDTNSHLKKVIEKAYEKGKMK